MQRIILSTCVTIISLIFNYQFAYATAFGKDSSELIKEACIDILKNTKPSYNGKTEEGNAYTVFAIKRGKEWTYVILDNTGFYSVRQNKGKDDVIENPQSSTEMLCLMFQRKLLKAKNKPKNVSGFTLSNYYRFRPSAKKTYRSVVKIQRKAKLINNAMKTPGGPAKLLKRSLQ